MQNTKKKLFSITNLKKYFPIAKSSVFQKEKLYVKANEDVSIDIYEGETFGLVGESGCGKSTLGRVILQLYEQTSGNTLYYGRSREEIAPEYVKKTLSAPEKYLNLYKDAKAKADNRSGRSGRRKRILLPFAGEEPCGRERKSRAYERHKDSGRTYNRKRNEGRGNHSFKSA